MTRPGLLVALLLAWTPIHASASGEFTSPSPNLLYQMQKQNSSQPRLWVRSNSTRLDLHVSTLDEEGLKGIRPHQPSETAPAAIRWSSIERIDEVATDAHRGRIIGCVVGVAAGAILGNLIGSSMRSETGVDPSGNVQTEGGNGGSGALVGAMALGGLGFWYGGRVGGRHVHEENWYAAERSSVPDSGHAAGQPVLRVSDLLPPRVVSTPFLTRPHGVPAAAPLTMSNRAEVLRACEQIDAHDLIRMRGDFGYFQGHAGVVGPAGFEGLRTGARRPIGSDASLELVTWDRIRTVDRRGNATRRGAMIGGLSFAVAGGLLGAAAGSFSETDGAIIGGAAIGAALSGAFGATLGALVGSMFPAWHNVYRAR